MDLNFYYGALGRSDLLISEKKLTEPIGHVEFVADNTGYYSICVKQSKIEQNPTRLKLTINYGFDNEYYEKLLKTEGIDALNLEIRKLNDMISMTLNEADYQKHKEVDYHEQTEEMNSATLWWPMLQIGILVITGVFQVQYLKYFFKANKVI